jgi:hypothetical protein
MVNIAFNVYVMEHDMMRWKSLLAYLQATLGEMKILLEIFKGRWHLTWLV